MKTENLQKWKNEIMSRKKTNSEFIKTSKNMPNNLDVHVFFNLSI